MLNFGVNVPVSLIYENVNGTQINKLSQISNKSSVKNSVQVKTISCEILEMLFIQVYFYKL